MLTPEKKARITEALPDMEAFCWGTQMPCLVCQRCLCYSCHPNGPCVPEEGWAKAYAKMLGVETNVS